jgi:hypothetical protein
LAATLQPVFTTEAEDAARDSGFRRRRAFSGATLVQTLTFGWPANPTTSLDELAELAGDLGCPVGRPERAKAA